VDCDEAWQAIDAQRIALTEVLVQLSDDEWRHQSLCRGWTVRDVVHSQDITIPLGRRQGMPVDAAALAASRIRSRNWPFYAKTRMRGYRLTADDVSWTAGEGADVHGPISAILLLLTGRLVALPQLSGDGAAALRATRQAVP
jgi:Mycothiol maleylpyruvate isomerase N-terminal domain